ncbi:hypothetical protein [Brevundimonas sp. Root1423]|nr:hypothetical protein [Brevundimonas sp. Root1423]
MTDPGQKTHRGSFIKRHGLFVLVVAEAILAAGLFGYVASGFWL